MRKVSTFFVFALLVFGYTGASARPCREVMGYYAGWKWYDRGKMVNPATIDYSNYTILAYAFFKPSTDGSVSCPDPWAERNLLSGIPNQGGRAVTLVSEAHRNGVKVVISIGGWTYSDVFPKMAADPGARKKFAASCVALVERYGIDGIDIDWEYPGYEKHGGSVADTRNFTLLIEALRQALDERSVKTGKKLLLSAAFGVSPVRLDAIEWDRVAGQLDLINLMSYNYSGPWEEFTGHNAPLFSTGPENSALNIDFTVKYLLQEKRVPASKINIGIAFFGRASQTSGQASLKGATTGRPDLLNFGEDQGAPEYYRIIDKLSRYSYLWDQTSGVPYLTGKNGNNSFVTFDDPRSVALKANYVLAAGLGGIIIWEITGDYLLDGGRLKTPLASAIKETLCDPFTLETNPGKSDAGWPLN